MFVFFWRESRALQSDVVFGINFNGQKVLYKLDFITNIEGEQI